MTITVNYEIVRDLSNKQLVVRVFPCEKHERRVALELWEYKQSNGRGRRRWHHYKPYDVLIVNNNRATSGYCYDIAGDMLKEWHRDQLSARTKMQTADSLVPINGM